MISVAPLTPDRWDHFAQLCRAMGPNRSCYCLWWREVGRPAAGGRRARAQQLVAESPRPIGVLAYDGVQPVGWAAVAPRLDFPRLNRGRDTAPVGAVEGFFVVPCFFVVESHRHQGVARELLAAAVEQARRLGALAVEGVPGDPLTEERTPSASYTGTVGLFRAAGFNEVARRSPTGRVVMRLDLSPSPPPG